MHISNGPPFRSLLRSAVLSGLAGIALCAAVPAFAQAFAPNADVDRIFERWKKPDSPGCSVAVSRKGSLVYSAGYGMADLDHGIPNTPGTVFHAASLAKQFTAMSILLLAADKDKALTLDDDVRQYVPELAGLKSKITIAQTLHHTSGIRDFLSLVTLAGWRLSEDAITRGDVLVLLRRMKTTDFAPAGSGWLYSNTNYFLAEQIIRTKTAGGSLADFARRNIFDPLAMKSTRFIERHGEVVANRAYERGSKLFEHGEALRRDKTPTAGDDDGGILD